MCLDHQVRVVIVRAHLVGDDRNVAALGAADDVGQDRTDLLGLDCGVRDQKTILDDASPILVARLVDPAIVEVLVDGIEEGCDVEGGRRLTMRDFVEQRVFLLRLGLSSEPHSRITECRWPVVRWINSGLESVIRQF